MARFDLINEFSSVYAPSMPASKPRRSRKVSQWTRRLAPFTVVAVMIVVIAAL